MLTAGRSFRTDRLIDLERTVDFLNGQLRKMQGDLYRAKAEPIPVRLWRNLVSLKGGPKFMSAVCNRRARPNTRWCPMLIQERRTEMLPVGACSDCGAVVQRRISCVDGMTHSTVELCERCWKASQQRQVFAGGCCG